MATRSYETRDMSHIYHKICADFVRDLSESLEIYNSGISACARKYQLGFALFSQSFDLVVIDKAGLFVNEIRYDIKIFTAYIDGAAVAEVSAVSEAHAEHGIAGLEQSEEYREVSARAAMRLNVCVLCAEQLFRSFDSQSFCYVDVFATAVISLRRISFRILVGQVGTRRRKNRGRNYVLACDKLNVALLSFEFGFEGFVKLNVSLFDRFEVYHNNSLVFKIIIVKLYYTRA